MKRRSIWIIIVLMSVAMIGIGALQMYWINWSIKLGKENFEINIQDALKDVSEYLRRQEQIETNSINFSNDSEKEKRLKKIQSQNLDLRLREVEKRLPSPAKLQQLIDSKLSANGIFTEYRYGVFSTRRNSFVIKNGNYQVDDFGPQVVVPEYTDGELQLINSRYRIDLYTSVNSTPGYLYLHFPYLNSFVWTSTWKSLLAALLFTGAILFCFIYTILIVFRQKKVSEMKTDFINNMTHEFKTPIATISLAADSIKSPKISGNVDKVTRFANIIKQENKRMLEQVEKVLQMAKFDRENLNLKLSQVDLHTVINQAVANISLQVVQKEGNVEAKLQASKFIIEADENHISNIIHNLLDNANKYTPEKPQIKVSTLDRAESIEITIQDNGIGLSKEAQKHIFEKFYRVHTGNLHDVKGFGLGLSYVKALVTAHSGTVKVKSELGKGSRFILNIPYSQPKQ